MKRILAAVAGVAVLAATPSFVEAEGNLAATPATRIDLALTGPGATPSLTTIELVTGKYYRLTLTTDGGAEALFTSRTFFDNVWINQVVVSGIEIKMWGDSFKGIEVGEQGAGEVQITFVAVRPGDYEFTIEGGPTDTVGKFVVK